MPYHAMLDALEEERRGPLIRSRIAQVRGVAIT